MIKHDDGSLQFTMQERTRPAGRTKVMVPSTCPLCDRRLTPGGWGYPNLATGDLRLHCMRCIRPGASGRADIAAGRRSQSGLPRGVTRADRMTPCFRCEHPILQGHLIERADRGVHQHVLCPTVCVRCEMPIRRGQQFTPRMSRSKHESFGWKHRACIQDDLMAKRERDAARNAERQRRAAERNRQQALPRGRQLARDDAREAASLLPHPAPRPQVRDIQLT